YHPAQSRRGIFIRPAIAQPARRRQTPVPHNHSRDGFERRQAMALIRRDGRRYAGARARPGSAQHHRFRDGRPARRRATALQRFRQRTRARIGDRRGSAKGTRSQGPPSYGVAGNVRRLPGDNDRPEDGRAVRWIGSAQGRLRHWLVITVASARWYIIGQGCRKEAESARVAKATLLTTDTDFDHLHDVFITREWIDPHRDIKSLPAM